MAALQVRHLAFKNSHEKIGISSYQLKVRLQVGQNERATKKLSPESRRYPITLRNEPQMVPKRGTSRIKGIRIHL